MLMAAAGVPRGVREQTRQPNNCQGNSRPVQLSRFNRTGSRCFRAASPRPKPRRCDRIPTARSFGTDQGMAVAR
jgi:hypothetical protein